MTGNDVFALREGHRWEGHMVVADAPTLRITALLTCQHCDAVLGRWYQDCEGEHAAPCCGLILCARCYPYSHYDDHGYGKHCLRVHEALEGDGASTWHPLDDISF